MFLYHLTRTFSRKTLDKNLSKRKTSIANNTDRLKETEASRDRGNILSNNYRLRSPLFPSWSNMFDFLFCLGWWHAVLAHEELSSYSRWFLQQSAARGGSNMHSGLGDSEAASERQSGELNCHDSLPSLSPTPESLLFTVSTTRETAGGRSQLGSKPWLQAH